MSISKTSIKKIFKDNKLTPTKTYVIAEIGINHQGSVDVCAEMIKKFSQVGADAVKLQTVDAKRSYAPDTESYKLFSQAELSQSETANMFELAKKLGLEVFTTSGDLQTLQWVDKLDPAAHKISSGLLSCAPIVRETLRLGKPVLMSTGLSDKFQINQTVGFAKEMGYEIGLFQCTSEYPCPEDQINLAAIKELERQYMLPVGFSDHSLGLHVAPLAVAAGAKMIEKHVTLDKSLKSFDHSISLTPEEFGEMIRDIRYAELVMGRAEKVLEKTLKNKAKRIERRIAAAYNFDSGHILSLEDLLFMRFSNSVDAIHSNKVEEVIGKEVKTKFVFGQPIKWRDLL